MDMNNTRRYERAAIKYAFSVLPKLNISIMPEINFAGKLFFKDRIDMI